MYNKYNGWSNYPTWRVWNDILADITFDEEVTEDEVMGIVNDVVFSNYEMSSGSHLVEDFATTFINLADYTEITEMINEDVQTKYGTKEII